MLSTYNLRAVLLLTAVYLALTANLQLSNIIAGLLLAILVLILLRPAPRALNWRFLPATIWALIRYILVLAYDLLISGIQVARIVLTPSLPIQQGNIAIPTTCQSETAQALSAHAITLTPGEMVVEMDDKGMMYTHVLDASHADENMADAQKMREEMLQNIVL
jgi:multicomponent Na+:H+ antiporter subunit E